MKKLYFLILMSFLISSCAPQLYNWKQYPSTLYAYKKDPSDEKLQNHKEMLLAIIESSNENVLRVPPGVYCECGFILLREGKKEEAIKFFDLEAKTYPESGVFIQNLKSYLNEPEKTEDKNTDSNSTKPEKTESSAVDNSITNPENVKK